MTQTLPALTEEELTRCPAPADPGFGALTTEQGPLPLKALAVKARLDGLLMHLELRQRFVNTHTKPLEATYIFPLPDRAAVTRFRLEVAGRVIEGAVKERGAARQEYDQALQAGQRAAITEEERPGVFTLRVGNLPPGESATVHLTLCGPLPCSDGEVTFRFPLVVAPRYIPGTPLPGPAVGAGSAEDTDLVPDASRIAPPVLLAGYPNPVRLALEVQVPHSAGYLTDFRSSLHTIQEQETGAGRRFVLQLGERLDRDFILRYRIADKHIRTMLALQPDEGRQEGTFLLTLVPPRQAVAGNAPRDIVFVLDRSGSMDGWKMVAARRALARMVETLMEQDRLAVLAFSSGVSTPGELGGKLRPASDRNCFLAAEFLAGLTAQGGTEMRQPLEQAVAELTEDLPGWQPGQRQRILVLVTDGQVGNEDDILRHLTARAKGIRIFTLGIDQAVNAAFLRRLSDLGGGSCALVESEGRLDEVMDQIHRHIATPLLTGLALHADGLDLVSDSLVPARLPDLFAGAPLMILGRYHGPQRGALMVRGRDGAGQPWSMHVDAQEGVPALAPVWARGRLRELEDRYLTSSDRERLEKEIVDLSLRFGVLCRFTAYVAVDREETVNPGGRVHSMIQPVEQPAGWGRDQRAQYELSRNMQMARAVGHSQTAMEAVQRIEQTAELMGPRAAKKTMLAKQVLQELNADGRVSKKTQLAVEDAARDAEPPLACAPPSVRQEERLRALAEPQATPHLWQRLLDFLGLGAEKDKAGPGLDRPAQIRQLRELTERMRGTDVADRLSVLGDILARKQELFGDLFAAGAPNPALELVGHKLLELKGVLGAPHDDAVAIAGIWDGLLAALSDLLLSLETADAGTTGSRRGGFWK